MRKDASKRVIEFLATGEKIGDFVAVKASDWVNGKGSYTSKRAIPSFAQEFERAKIRINAQRGTAERAALKYFESNPRVKKVIIMSIMEATSGLIDG